MFLLTFQILYNPGQIENNYLIEIFRLYSYKRRYQIYCARRVIGITYIWVVRLPFDSRLE